MKRLGFVLPEWTRRIWVSEAARAEWEPRLSEINQAWERIERWSVIDGARGSCLTFCDASYLPEMFKWAIDRGVACLPLAVTGMRDIYSATPAPVEPGKPFQFRVVLCRPDLVDAWYDAWEPVEDVDRTTQDDRIGELLGFPPCCREFFRRVWVEEKFVDTTWPYALGSSYAPAAKLGQLLEFFGDQRRIKIGGPPEANILLRWLGVRLVSHLPCSPRCAATVKVGEMFRHVAKARHFDAQLEDLENLLRMPVEWSARHGIATITTPIVQVSSRTDATAETYTVRRDPQAACFYPAESAYGTRFPYRQRPPEVVPLTRRKSFAVGIDAAVAGLDGELIGDHTRAEATGDLLTRVLAPVEVTYGVATEDVEAGDLVGIRELSAPAPLPPASLWEDNGFTSREGMDAAHAPIVETVRLLWPDRKDDGRYLLELGAGNGELARKLLELDPLPHTPACAVLVDQNAEALGRNQCHKPDSVARVGDLRAAELWQWLEGRDDRFAFVVFMPGRLLEWNQWEQRLFLVRLAALEVPVVVYAYGDWLGREHGDGLAELCSRAFAQAPTGWTDRGFQYTEDGAAAAVIDFEPFPEEDHVPMLDGLTTEADT